MTAKQTKEEILKLLNDAAEKAGVELTNEINQLGSYGLVLALLNKDCYTVHKIAKSVKAIHLAISATRNMEE
jgi:hypothetical protein